MSADILKDFVDASHKEKGKRVKLAMKKQQGSAGFCLKASGSKEAMEVLVMIMNKIDLEKHQLPEDDE